MQFGKSKAKLVTKETPEGDLRRRRRRRRGGRGARRRSRSSSQEPAKFQAVGAKIPKGVLLYGPPGTGKTLLARAVAGEAGVPFFSISGSDFVEMFVGVGASRVRDLFEQAKAERARPSSSSTRSTPSAATAAPASAAATTSASRRSTSCSSRWTASTSRRNVILIAATNRPDILDPALLRPGRFDRQIARRRPRPARAASRSSRCTPRASRWRPASTSRPSPADPGFTGADLANVLNEAALLTARSNAQADRRPRAGRGDRPRHRRPAEAQPA